jgi:hypothetical protein
MMKKTIFVMAIAMAFIAVTAQGSIIEFRNADFEDETGYSGGYGYTGINDWVHGGWVRQGENIAAFTSGVGGVAIAQDYVEDDLGNMLELVAGDNDFSISVDISTNAGGSATPYIQIYSNSQFVGESAAIAVSTDGTTTYDSVTFDFTVDGTDFAGQSFLVQLMQGSGYIYADNFSGSVVPEPATMMLLGLGGLLLRRRKA